jgi:hypothetical protein
VDIGTFGDGTEDGGAVDDSLRVTGECIDKLANEIEGDCNGRLADCAEREATSGSGRVCGGYGFWGEECEEGRLEWVCGCCMNAEFEEFGGPPGSSGMILPRLGAEKKLNEAY